MGTKDKKRGYGFYFILHLVIISTIVLSPFFINWKVLLLLTIANFLLFGVWLKYCPVTKWQFGNTNHGFIQHYLNKLGLNVSNKNSVILMRYVVPLTIVASAFIYQALQK